MDKAMLGAARRPVFISGDWYPLNVHQTWSSSDVLQIEGICIRRSHLYTTSGMAREAGTFCTDVRLHVKHTNRQMK